MKRMISMGVSGAVLLAGTLVTAAAIAPAGQPAAPTVTVYKSPT